MGRDSVFGEKAAMGMKTTRRASSLGVLGTAEAARAVELLAELIVEKLDGRERTRAGWVSADVVAAHLSVEVSYVYEHAEELGAVRLGGGRKARLRFNLDLVDDALTGASTFSDSRGSEEAGSGTAAPIRRVARTAREASAQPLPVRPIWSAQ